MSHDAPPAEAAIPSPPADQCAACYAPLAPGAGVRIRGHTRGRACDRWCGRLFHHWLLVERARRAAQQHATAWERPP